MEYYEPIERYQMGPETVIVEEVAGPSNTGVLGGTFPPRGGRGYGLPSYLDAEYERPVQYEYAPRGYELAHPFPAEQHRTAIQRPPHDVVPQSSDLGQGLRDSNLERPSKTDRGLGFWRSEHDDDGDARIGEKHKKEMKKMKKELEKEKRKKHVFELATAAALGYGIHERHEKNDVEKDLKKYEKGKEEKKEHRFFTTEGWF